MPPIRYALLHAASMPLRFSRSPPLFYATSLPYDFHYAATVFIADIFSHAIDAVYAAVTLRC